MTLTTSRLTLAGAGAAGVALALTACGVGSDPAPFTAPQGPPAAVTISLATYGDLDYSSLAAQYEAAHPGVTIELSRAEDAAIQYEQLTAALAGGELNADVVAVEEDWLGDLVAHPEATVDLGPLGATSHAADFAPWMLAESTSASGEVFAVPVEVRPLALCFNGARLEAAGLPRDRDAVAKLFGGDWQRTIEFAVLYKEATGAALFDNGAPLWAAMSRQIDGGFYDEAGAVSVADNAAVAGKWKLFTDALSAGVAAKAEPGAWGDGASLVDGTFAAFVCEPQRLDEVQALVEAAGGDASTGWDVADALPGGGASAGGAYLAVGTNAEQPTEAAAFALWLALPDQQAALYAAAGVYPAATGAQAQVAALIPAADFFAGAPVGDILASRAQQVVPRTVGQHDVFLDVEVFGPAVKGLADGTLTAEQAWTQLVAALADLEPAPSPTVSPSPPA